MSTQRLFAREIFARFYYRENEFIFQRRRIFSFNLETIDVSLLEMKLRDREILYCVSRCTSAR